MYTNLEVLYLATILGMVFVLVLKSGPANIFRLTLASLFAYGFITLAVILLIRVVGPALNLLTF